MSLELVLEGGTDFEPGQVVAGEVRAEGMGRLVVSLLWHTAGKGTEDIGVVAREEADLDGPRTLPFRFVLPREPWSFSGRLVSVKWAVEATVEPGGGVVRQAIVSAPGRQPRTP